MSSKNYESMKNSIREILGDDQPRTTSQINFLLRPYGFCTSSGQILPALRSLADENVIEKSVSPDPGPMAYVWKKKK